MTDASSIDILSLVVIGLGLFAGGVIKGATGAGMPLVAVPLIAAFYDVRLAVVVLVIPSFITNTMQAYRYRAQEPSRRVTRQVVATGVAGASIGTLLLVSLPAAALNLLMAALVFVYVGLRLWRPDFGISLARAEKTAWIAGGVGGVLQGAVGISAPAILTFLSAVRLPRQGFIFTVSAFFASMCIPQFVVQLGFGLMTWQTGVVGCAAVAPLMVGMSIGEWLGKRMSPVLFDRIILGLLVVLAVKLAVEAGLS